MDNPLPQVNVSRATERSYERRMKAFNDVYQGAAHSRAQTCNVLLGSMGLPYRVWRLPESGAYTLYRIHPPAGGRGQGRGGRVHARGRGPGVVGNDDDDDDDAEGDDADAAEVFVNMAHQLEPEMPHQPEVDDAVTNDDVSRETSRCDVADAASQFAQPEVNQPEVPLSNQNEGHIPDNVAAADDHGPEVIARRRAIIWDEGMTVIDNATYRAQIDNAADLVSGRRRQQIHHRLMHMLQQGQHQVQQQMVDQVQQQVVQEQEVQQQVVQQQQVEQQQQEQQVEQRAATSQTTFSCPIRGCETRVDLISFRDHFYFVHEQPSSSGECFLCELDLSTMEVDPTILEIGDQAFFLHFFKTQYGVLGCVFMFGVGSEKFVYAMEAKEDPTKEGRKRGLTWQGLVRPITEMKDAMEGMDGWFSILNIAKFFSQPVARKLPLSVKIWEWTGARGTEEYPKAADVDGGGGDGGA